MAAQPVVGCNADANALKEAGNVAFSSGKHLQAWELFSEAILLDPSSALLRSNRSAALASLGRHDEAFADAELCCKLQPDWWKGYTRRGHAEFHLKRYTESEQSFMEALRLNPGEKTVLEGLTKTKAALGQPGFQAAAGPRVAAAGSGPPAAVFQPPPVAYAPGSLGGGATAGAAGASSSSTLGPSDFHRLSSAELKRHLEMGASKLSDDQLDLELRLAGVYVPPGASRDEKVQLYVQTPDDPKAKPKAKAKPVSKICGCFLRDLPEDNSKSEGEKMLEWRKKKVEEWNTWDEDRLVKRLAKLGLDGDGLSRDQLMDELMKVETENYANRCHPARIQKYALVCVGGAVFLTFLVVVMGMLV